jgi:hypothetical protein
VNRPLRAGLVATAVVTTAALVFATVLGRAGCGSRAQDDVDCLGRGLVLAVLCALAVLLTIAWGLRGRGRMHAVLGAVACPFVGYGVTDRLTFVNAWFAPDRSGHDAAAAVAFGLVSGGLTWLWARFGPDLGPAQDVPRNGAADKRKGTPS